MPPREHQICAIMGHHRIEPTVGTYICQNGPSWLPSLCSSCPNGGAWQLVIQFLSEAFAFTHSKNQNIPHQLSSQLHVGPRRAYLISIIKCFKVEGNKLNPKLPISAKSSYKISNKFKPSEEHLHVRSWLVYDIFADLILSQNLRTTMSYIFFIASVAAFHDVS